MVQERQAPFLVQDQWSTSKGDPIMKIKDIKTNPNNPRTITPERRRKLIDSLTRNPRFMELRGIILDEDNMIRAGSQRFDVLVNDLGYKEIPDEWIQKATDFTEDELHEFVVMDNISYGSWDWDLLNRDYKIEEVKYWGVEIPVEVDPPGLKQNLKDQDMIPDTKKNQFKVTRGDTWRLGDHLLYCGDSTQQETIKALMGKEKANLLLTDPPYNVDYTGKTKEALKIDNDTKSDAEYLKFLFDAFRMADAYMNPGAVFYVWHADSEGLNVRTAIKNVKWLMKQTLIWNKNIFVMGRQDYQWKHEPCLYGWKPGAGHEWYADRKQTTVLDFDRPMRSKEHPTMKPINLFTYQIVNSTKPMDIVLDSFGGSGTTLIACENTKRKCRMVEYDPHYCSVIINRWQQFTEKEAVKI